MLTREALQVPRAPKQLSLYLAEVFTSIRRNTSARHAAQSRKGLYKQLIEELWPISWYFERKYYDTSFRLKLKLGNQPFDAEIIDDRNQLVEQIEISWPINGRRHAGIVEELNRKGYGGFETYEDPLEKIREVFEFTITGAHKKAVRDYRSEMQSTLALIVDLSPYYDRENDAHQYELERLTAALSEITYRVNNVVLLVANTRKVMML